MSDNTLTDSSWERSDIGEKGWFRLKATGFVVGLLLMGSVGLAAASGMFSINPATADAKTTLTPSMTNTINGNADGFVQVAEMVTKAVVNISPSKSMPSSFEHDPMPRPWGSFRYFNFPHPHGMPPHHRSGSGVVVSPDGHILTNYHVVEGATEVTVTFPDSSESIGKVIGTDPKTDLAVIDVDRENLPYLKWGSSTDLHVGEPVLAVGTPFGLTSTVTQGIVSGLGRGGMGITHYEDFIQTDAAINPGNSGGALTNARGELIGINTAILSRTGGNHGVGFAIPADMAKRVYHDLIETGTVRRGYLGVSIQRMTADLAEAFNHKGHDGTLVTSVHPGSAAEKAGVAKGDIVTEFNGTSVNTPQDLQRVVTQTSVGTEITLTVIRDGDELKLNTRLGEHPDTHQVADSRTGEYENALAAVNVEPFDSLMARRLGLDADLSGVVVTSLAHESAAERLGLVRGDLITEVNGSSIASVADYQREVSKIAADENVLLYIWRNQMPMFMTITA